MVKPPMKRSPRTPLVIEKSGSSVARLSTPNAAFHEVLHIAGPAYYRAPPCMYLT
jgi:hypothetical protein